MRRAIVVAVALVLSGPLPLSRQEPSLAPLPRAFTTANVRLREAPSMAASIVVVIPRGTLVAVSDCDADWCAVQTRSLAGFSARRYLVVSDPLPSDTSPSGVLAAPAPER